MTDKLIKVEYIIPASIQEDIANKINERVKDSYYWNVTKAVSDKVLEALNEDGFAKRISDEVVSKIKMSEDEYIENVSIQVKEALINTTGIIAKEVLEEVSKKVQSYGFIKIGR